MNNRKIIYFILLICPLFIISCEDSRFDTIVDDKVYIMHSGLREIEISNSGQYTYSLYVIKSGIGKQAVNVQLAINESILNSYNENNGTDFSLLPEQYYKIAVREKNIEKDEYQVPFEIVFDTNAILELQADSEKKYVLPCEVKVLNSVIEIGGDENMTSILVPLVKEANPV